MKKNIITLVAISLSLSGCGIYTKLNGDTPKANIESIIFRFNAI